MPYHSPASAIFIDYTKEMAFRSPRGRSHKINASKSARIESLDGPMNKSFEKLNKLGSAIHIDRSSVHAQALPHLKSIDVKVASV